jgi:RNA polymerase sigma-70 factor, ECF subfamily
MSIQLPQNDDQTQVAALRAGDCSALEQIFCRHRDTVYRFAMAFTGNVETANDVTQETFLQLVQKPHGFDPTRGALGAYLCGVARNCARAMLREAPFEKNLELPDSDDPVWLTKDADTTLTTSAFDLLANNERDAALWRALRALQPHYREVLILVEMQDFTYAQAAQILEVEIGTVRSRISRGKQRLQTVLQSFAPNESKISC